MMNVNDLKGKTRQMKDWRRRFVALVAALTLLISSCGLTAFAESDDDIYSAPVTAPIAPANTSPEPEEGTAEVTPAPEGQEETGTEPDEGTGEETGENADTETEGEPEVSEEPEDLSAYESGTLVAEADSVGVTLDYTPEARIPEGTVLTLSRATGGDLYSAMKSAARVLKEEQNETWQREVGDEAVFYLLTLTNPEGIAIHPSSGITFTCVNLPIPEGSTGFVTGTESANLDWDTNLTLEFLPEAIGYATLKQVQIGTITLVHNDRDYMVTASYGPEAGFPFGTALKVREIMPGTPEYALYSGMTDEALNEDWSEITLERYFDISFVKGDVELEPQGDVDVQITFRDKIEENEDTEVAAVHIENNEATVIESETDSQKAAKHDDEAIDTVTFTSDSFSVYGVVQKKKIVTKILDAQGHTYEIEVTYTQEAEIPEDAQVKVEEIPEGSDLWEAYRKQTAAALNADDVRLPGLYDISIVDAEGNKVEPKAPVNVAFKLLNDDTTKDIQVVHFKEEIPQELVEAAAQETETIKQIEAQPAEQTEDLIQTIKSETINAKVEGDTVSFSADGFSVYAFAYTVYFEYMGRSYEMLGNSEILLSKLLEVLETGVTLRDITGVSYTGTSLELTVTDGNDCLIRVIPNADEESVLTINTADKVIEIEVAATGKESVDLGDAVISSADGVYLPDDATGSIEYAGEDEEVISLIQESTTEAATTETAETEPETSGQTEEQTTEQAEEQTTEQAEEPTAEQTEEQTTEQTEKSKEISENGTAEQTVVTQTFYQVYDISLENVDEENYAAGFQVEMKLSEKVQGDNVHLYHVHDGQVSEITEFDLTGDNLTFVTENFSYFVISYTVEFEYMGRSYEMLGNSEILLSKLLEVLETGATISDVTGVSYTGTSVELTETDENDSLIKIIPNADEESVLTINTADKVFEIKVAATGKESVDLGDAVISSADGVYLPDDATGSIEYAGEHEEIISLIQESISENTTTETTETEADLSRQNEEQVIEQTGNQAIEQAEDQATEQTEQQTTEQAEEPIAEQTENLVTEQAEEQTNEPIAEQAEEQTTELTNESKETTENGTAEQTIVTRTFYQVYDINLENVDEENYAAGFRVEMKLNEKVEGDSVHLYHVHDGQVSEITEFDLTEDNLSFITENFSHFVISYTVDFIYIDPENNEEFAWSWPGRGSYKIADIMKEIGVNGEIVDVQLERTIDMGGAENVLYLSEDKTELISDEAFQDTFELTVKVEETVEGENVEKTYVIVVTDENNNRYKIRLRFSDGSTQPVVGAHNQGGQTSTYYYVLAKISHTNSSTSYAYANVDVSNPSTLPLDEDGYHYIDFEFSNWKNYEGDNLSECFTGNEQSIEVRLVRCFQNASAFRPEELLYSGSWQVKANAGKVYNETEQLNSYTIHYDTRDSRNSSAYYTEEGEDNIIWHYDQIDLNSRTASSDYDYTTILGPNLVYGIVAEHLYQPNHLQTNFAVNHFSGHGHDVRPDLSGNSAGNIVIAQFNESDGSKRNSVGNVANDPVWGRMKVGKPLKGTLFAYVDENSGYQHPDGSVYDNPAQTVVVPMDGAYLSEHIVEPGIEYGKRISAELLKKPATISPEISGNKAVIDSRDFEEYDTIYVDGDLLKDYIGTSGALTIKKRDHQTIVFNFDNKSISREISIRQFNVIQPSFAQYGYPEGYKTESPEATGSDQNKVMDEIARHIVWNLAACTRKVTIDTAGGIFLQPNDDSETFIQGTTAGWIVSDGYVYNGTAEWHNVFEEMPESISVNLSALKYVDNKVPKVDVKFNFQLEKLDYTRDPATGKVKEYSWRVLDTKTNNLAQVQFDMISQDDKNLKVGWNIFKITEIGPHVDNTGHYITDTSEYFAAVLVQEYLDAQDKTDYISYRVEQPLYYTSFEINNFQPFRENEDAYNPVLTGMGAERVAIPAFRNETVTTGLTLVKHVEGTDLTSKLFTFQVKLWTEEGGVKHNLDITSVKVAGGLPRPLTVESDASGYWSTFEITLRNGRKVTFEELPKGVHYEFTETKVGTKVINEENADEDGYIDGYKPLTFTDNGGGNITYSVSGEISDPDKVTAKIFDNEYRSKGEIDLNVKKELQEKQLLENMFAFTISGGKMPIIGYNDSEGYVTFAALPEGKLSFDQSDMVGATKNEAGYLVKEITYVISEGKGTLSDAEVNTAWNITDFSYENVVYDADKVITLVLTDMGNGVITVQPKNPSSTALEVTFNNSYKQKGHQHFAGSKILEGRPITKAEFIFNAVLTSINNVAVPTDTDINNETNDAQRAILEERRAEMIAKVSSANVYGTNEAQEIPDPEGSTNYTAEITFPEIYFSEPGTYVYTITEDTDSMPLDTKQKASSTTSYTATIVVNEQPDGTLVAANPVYSPTPMTFINETKFIGFIVTKSWLNTEGNSVNSSKFITFSVTFNGTKLTAADLTEKLKNMTPGSIEWDGDNVKLISDANGDWPIARFEGLIAGRYVIEEVSHTATTNVGLRTTYAVLADGDDSANAKSTNIVREDNSTLTITNKETKEAYTNITIKKKWKAGETEYVPTEGSVTLELHALKIIGRETEGNSNNKIEVRIGDIPGTLEGNIGDYVEIKAHGNIPNFDDLGTNNGTRCRLRYYTGSFSGSETFGGEVYPISPTKADKSNYGQNDSVPVTFRIPINDIKYVSGGTSSSTKSMKIEIQTLNNWGIDSAVIVPGQTTEEQLITTITLSNSNNWTWTKTRLPISQNDGNITYKYYIKEIDVPNGFTVTYSPTGSNGQSGYITNAGSATITAINTQPTTVEKIARKVWDGTPPGTPITLKLYAGTTAEDAAASTKAVRSIILDGTKEDEPADHNKEDPGWTAHFYDLPKFDTAGNELVYIIKESPVPSGYSVSYSQDGDSLIVTNTKNPGNLELEKLVSGDGADLTKEFAFTIDLTAPADKTLAEGYVFKKNGETVEATYSGGGDNTTARITGIALKANDVFVIEDLPAGTTYDITEDDYTAEGYTASTTGTLNGTITGGTTTKETVQVTNTFAGGNLTVSKAIDGNEVDNNKEFNFTVTFSKSNLIGVHGSYKTGTAASIESAAPADILFADGTATISFTLRGGERAEFVGLPNGTTFEVNEISKDADGYETTVSSEGGTVTDGKTVTGAIGSDGATVTAAYTNTKESTTVSATKYWTDGTQTVEWPVVGEIQTSVEFTLFKTVNGTKTKVVANDLTDFATDQQKLEFINPITVTSSSSTATWDNLPKKYWLAASDDPQVTAGWYAATYTVEETEIIYNNVSYTAETTPAMAEMFDIRGSGEALVDGHIDITNRLYQTTINVLKQSGETQDPLSGATFKLWRYISEDNYSDYGSETSSSEVGSVGRLSFQNLPNGCYRLEETEAPAGFNRLGGYIYFKIVGGVVTWTDSSFETEITDGNGNKPDQVAYTVEGGFVIDNTPGVELPATGGSGTLIYTIAGMALIVLAGVMLVSRRKRKA